jgi:hypothetical protein
VEPAVTIVLVGLLITWIRYVKFRRALARLEGQVRRLRQMGTRALTYRRIESGDVEHAAKITRLDVLAGELARADLVVLGDAIESQVPQPCRWFADREGTMFGWIAALERPGRRIAPAVLMSCAIESPGNNADTFWTRRAVGATLCAPPFVRRTMVSLATSIADLISAHRKLVGDTPSLVRVTTLDEAFAQSERMRARVVAWRERQPVGELLERDLRDILGKHYPRLGPRLAKRLQIDLPKARVV